MTEKDVVTVKLLSELPSGAKFEKVGMCKHPQVVIVGKCKQGKGVCPIINQTVDIDFADCWNFPCIHHELDL